MRAAKTKGLDDWKLHTIIIIIIIYIYIYIIQASCSQDDGTQFIILNCNF